MTTAAIAVLAALSSAACGADDTAGLEERVRELEDENTALRTQISALEAGVTTTTTTTTDGPTVTSEPPDPSATTSSPPSDGSAPAVPSSDVPTTPVAPLLGTRERPHPAGTEFRSGDWTLTVTAFEGNADAVVAGLSPDNPPPSAGTVYARVRVRAVYNGNGGGNAAQLRINLLSPSGSTVGTADVCCEPERNALADQPETFAGGVVEGWIYYQVAAADLFAGQFIAFDPNADQPGVPGGVVFFAVAPA